VQVKDVMTKEVESVEVPGTRTEALELLRKLGVSSVPVVKRGTKELVGMVTLRNLFEHPDEMQLAMLVNREIATIASKDSLKEAARKLLDSRLRRLPVVDNGKLVGVITVRDIVYRAIATMNIEKPISDYARRRVIAIWDGTPLKAAIEIMELSGFGALPVVDEEGGLVGILNDSDIVNVSEVETESKMSQMAGRSEGDRWTWDSENRIYVTKRMLKIPDKLVREVMTKELVTATRRTSVSRCAELMSKRKVKQIPLMTAGKEFVGIVRDSDLLRALIE
jgi:CBS domain-containing protein